MAKMLPHMPAKQDGMHVKLLAPHEKVEGTVHGQMAASHKLKLLLDMSLQRGVTRARAHGRYGVGISAWNTRYVGCRRGAPLVILETARGIDVCRIRDAKPTKSVHL